jgi:uncharacterized protein
MSAMHGCRRLLCCGLMLAACLASPAFAADAPWGTAEATSTDYAPRKVVYDVAVADVASFEQVLDRASYLNNLYGADPFSASIVLVLHGDEINFFATRNLARYRDLMQRAQSLTLAGPLSFRVCRLAAAAHGYEPGQLHGFVEVVPMADAEIVRLQQEEGYAYMR